MKQLKDMTDLEFHDLTKAVGDMIEAALPSDAVWNLFVVERHERQELLHTNFHASHNGNGDLEQYIPSLLNRTRLALEGIEKEEIPMTKLGVFTPNAMVLCEDCVDARWKAERNWKPRSPGEHDTVTTPCDRCGCPMLIGGRDDVVELNNLRHAINAVMPGAAILDQTGGMCCALDVPLTSPRRLAIYIDDEGTPKCPFGIVLYADDQGDEGTTVMDFADTAIVIDHVREFIRDYPPTKGD